MGEDNNGVGGDCGETNEILEQVAKIIDGYIMMYEGLAGFSKVNKAWPIEYKAVIDQLLFFEPVLKNFVMLYLSDDEIFFFKAH